MSHHRFRELLTRRFSTITPVVLAAVVLGCGEPTNASSDSPATGNGSILSVSSISPAEAPQDVTLEIQVSGSGFDKGSQVALLRVGTADSRVRVASTSFVAPDLLRGSIVIAADALATIYSVAVTTSKGKTATATNIFSIAPLRQIGPSGSLALDVNGSGIIVGARPGGCNNNQLPVAWGPDGTLMDLPLLSTWCDGDARRISSNGIIVGGLHLGAAPVAVRWMPTGSGYRVESIGTPPNIAAIDIADINAAGHILAVERASRGLPFWWSEGSGFVPLTFPTGVTGCGATAMNDADEIVGTCLVNNVNKAVFWSSPSSAPTDLPKLSGSDVDYRAVALNNNGMVAGTGGGGVNAPTADLVFMAVRWVRVGDTWTVESLGNLGGHSSEARGINDAGAVIGSSDMGIGKSHAFLSVPGQVMRDLGSFGIQTVALAINSPVPGNALLVVGYADTEAGLRAIVWRP